MTPIIRIYPEAQEEAEAALEWYRERSHRAALEFLSALRSAFTQLSNGPLRFPDYVFGTRRILLRRFPYVIVFQVADAAINVVAVAHGRRKPGYWRGRIG